jgi:hypothetical protein
MYKNLHPSKMISQAGSQIMMDGRAERKSAVSLCCPHPELYLTLTVLVSSDLGPLLNLGLFSINIS